MALKKHYVDDSGIDFPDAYFRVSGFLCPEFDAKEIEIIVKVYKDSEKRNKLDLNEDKPFMVKRFFVNNSVFDNYFNISILKENNIDFRMKAYDYLKSEEPYFSDAVDEY